jgi:hypothetical protein
MSLQGLQNPALIQVANEKFHQFVENVRLFIRDYPELNRLVDGEESSNRLIAFSAIDAISNFNSTPPILGQFGFLDFTDRGWTSLLRIGTVANLLISVGLLQTRNQLPFSDGGLNVSVSDKTPLLQNWIQLFQNQWENQVRQLKVALNINQLFGVDGGVASEYFDIHGYYTAYYPS